MTNSFQSTAFQSATSPVDTFVQPVTVQPKSGAEELAEILQAVNPGLQAFIGQKIEDKAEEEFERGMEIAIEQSKKNLKNTLTNIRKDEGDEAVRQLIGGSFLAKAGYEKQKAILAGDSVSRKIKTFHNTYTVQQIKNGQEISIPISHFDVGSPEYQTFLDEAASYETEKLEGIRKSYLNKYFLPKQASALEKITEDQIKNFNEFSYQRTKNQALPTIFNNLETYIDGDKETALANVNEYIEDNVTLGLASDKNIKFFDSLLDIGKSSITRLYDTTGKISDIDSAIEMIGDINYGPNGTSKFKNHPKFETTFLKLKDSLADSKDKNDKRELEKIKAAEDQTIEKILEKYPNDVERANALLDFFPFRKKKVLETIEIFETDRSSRYQDLQLDVGSGLYANRPDEALEELKEIWDSHGGTATQEDEDNYERTFSVIQNFKKAAPVNYNTRISKAVNQANTFLGGKYDEYGYTFEDNTKGMQAIELENEFTRNVIDQIQNTTGLSNEEKENKFRILKDAYIAEAQRIGSGKTEEEVVKEQEIQALSDDSGLSIDQIKQILSEEGMETVIGPNNMTETNTEEINTDNEPGGSGKSFFEIIGRKDDLPQIESRVIQELTSMGGVTRENRNKLIEQVIEEKEKMNVTNIAGKSQADSIIKFLQTGEYGFGFGGPKTYEPLKLLVDSNNLEASGFSDDDTPTTVTVEAGDTLGELAEQFGVPLQAFMEANNITNADLIRAGQELVVPMVDMRSNESLPMQNMLPESELNELRQQIKVQTDNDQPLTKQQINKILINAGFTQEQAKVMTAIAMAESANRANAFYGGTEEEPEESYGLFQINMFNYKGMELGNDRRPKLGIDNNNALYDPVLNAIAAKLVFDETQAQRGNGYLAWGVYSKDGKTEDPNARYKQFLD